MENTLLGLLLMVIFVGIPGAALAIRWVLRPLLRELGAATLALKKGTEGGLEERVAALERANRDLGRMLAGRREPGEPVAVERLAGAAASASATGTHAGEEGDPPASR